MKAFLLAAGYGKRLRPYTDSLPKPLIEVADKPLIQYQIEKLAAAGVKELVINAHWLAEKLIEYLGDGSQFGVSIQWSVEEQLLETGGGIAKALPLLGDEPFLVLNGDVYSEYPIENLVAKKLGGCLAHLVLVVNPAHNQSGDFFFAEVSEKTEGKLAREEGDNGADKQNNLTYTGMALIDSKLISSWESENPAFPLLEPLRAAASEGRLSGELYQGLWEDVGTKERLVGLNELLSENSAPNLD